MGKKEREVETFARLRVSCLRCIKNNVNGILAVSTPIRIKMNIFLFINTLVYLSYIRIYFVSRVFGFFYQLLKVNGSDKLLIWFCLIEILEKLLNPNK